MAPAALALVFAIAACLQGEASAVGPVGMVAVADSMLARHEAGETWESILTHYYGKQEPGEAALRIAETAINRPWRSQGMAYCLSGEDVRGHGWREGDIVIRRGAWELHLYKEWPGDDTRRTGNGDKRTTDATY